MESLNERILVGVTAKKGRGWKRKLKEIKKNKIKRFALFIEEIPLEKRKKLYNSLKKIEIEEIPLIHIRHDTTKEELSFLEETYKTKYFTIHEDHFDNLDIWKDFKEKLFLEFSIDDEIKEGVDVEKIGGFCIDLSHFKKSEISSTKEFEYVSKRKENKALFKCNHLNGYNFKKNSDVHYVKEIKEFDYIKSLPNYLFGEVIAIEMYNSIKKQLKYKEYLNNLLGEK